MDTFTNISLTASASHDQQRTLQTPVATQKANSRGSWCGRYNRGYNHGTSNRSIRGTGQGQQTTTQSNEHGIREPLAIAASDDTNPPCLCRYCGGSHWDKECKQFGQPVSTFHHYSPEISQE